MVVEVALLVGRKGLEMQLEWSRLILGLLITLPYFT